MWNLLTEDRRQHFYFQNNVIGGKNNKGEEKDVVVNIKLALTQDIYITFWDLPEMSRVFVWEILIPYHSVNIKDARDYERH